MTPTSRLRDRFGSPLFLASATLAVSCLTSAALAQTQTQTQTRPALPPMPAPATRPAEAPPSPPSAETLSWLTGSWGSTSESGRVSEELWLPPAGGVLFGVNRTISSDGKLLAFEHLRIEERDGGLVYLAAPGGRQPPTEFPAVHVTVERAVFENPEHDFPQRITYRLDEVLRTGETRLCFRVSDMEDEQGFGGCWTRR